MWLCLLADNPAPSQEVNSMLGVLIIVVLRFMLGIRRGCEMQQEIKGWKPSAFAQ